jgi:hypothetical protein
MLVAAVQDPARRASTVRRPDVDRDARAAGRLAIYANEAKFPTHRDLFNKEWAPHRAVHFLAARVAGVPLAVDWLASRHPAIQLALFEAKFFGFQSASSPDADLPALISYYRTQQDKEGFTGIRRVLLQYDLLAGRLDDVQRGMTAIEDIVGDERRAIEPRSPS